MRIVRCNSCRKWIGRADNPGLYYGMDTEYCLGCKCPEALMDVDYGCKFDSWELERLWKMFGDIPVSDDDEITEEFLGFSEGTDRIEIWHWFDEQYPRGVACLVYKD